MLNRPHTKGARRDRGREFPLFSTPVESLIDGARLMLAAVALLTIAIEPIQPPEWVPIVRDLMVGYVAFAAVLLAVPAERKQSRRPQLAVHAIDIAVISTLVYFSEGPTGHFLFYNFALIAATLRWSWRGAVA